MLKNFLSFLILSVLGGTIIGSPVFAAGNLIKTKSSPAVYYLADNNLRHLFPIASVYKSWYQDFSGIKVLAPKEMAQYPLGKNIPVRPGLNIVSFETDINLYAVEPGGVLRRFASPEAIKGIYGPGWEKRIIKLPDVLFGDYQKGEDIRELVELPDGLVYKLTNDGKYYYKKNNLIWPFKDLKGLAENNFKIDGIVSSNIEFNKRKKEISGFDQNIFNPVAEPLTSTADCENKKFKVAFLFITDGAQSTVDMAKIKIIKERLAENFPWATGGLVSANVDYPAIILSGDEKLFYKDLSGKKQIDNEAINIFYDKNPDIFDFIILYNNFIANEPDVAHYLKITNNFTGTGNGERDASRLFGSRGKLKGVANMGNLNKYSIENEDALNQSVNYILHEILHHFSARARFKTEDGSISTALLTGENFDHWSKYVDFVSPVGGGGWIDNGDGTFTNGATLNTSLKKKFSNLDLYFMGLWPKMAVGPIKYLAPDKAGDPGNIISAKLKAVTIDQIVNAMGDWNCQL
ncbi:MAG: hypothetical protein WC610_02975 [Patescibacteria group bacterium]